MLTINWKKTGLIVGLSLSLMITGCGQEDNEKKSVSEEMDFTITGLEPGAGQTELNEKVIEEYENLAGWEQQTSSTGAMLAALDEAIRNEEPIMITAWSPHFMFAKWDIKYLEDPKGIFGEAQHGATIVRNGLKEDLPNAYTILDRMHFEVPDLEQSLLKAHEEELDIEEVAKQWVEENQETVAKWREGVESVDGKSIEVVSTLWDDMVFTGNVAKIVLEQQGYNVNFTSLDPAVVFEAISTGDADATLSPWLPTTHGDLYDEYTGNFEDLGPNFEGASIGLAVPSYVEVDSLEDFDPEE